MFLSKSLNIKKTEFNIFLFLSIIILPISITIAFIFLLIVLFSIKKNNTDKINTNNVSKDLYNINILWYIFCLGSIIQGMFTIIPIYHYAGFLSHYLIYWLILWIVLQIIKIENIRMIISSFILSAGIIASFGIANFWGWTYNIRLFQLPWYDKPYLIDLQIIHMNNQVWGFAMNPNILGVYLMLSVPLCIGLIFDEEQITEKIIWGGILLILLLCILFSFSRGTWINTIIILVLLSIYNRKIAITFILFSIGIMVLYFLFSVNMNNYWVRLLTIFDPLFHSNFVRLNLWKSAMNIIKDFPFSGIGILHYELIFPCYQLFDGKGFHFHNWYLQIVTESGIPLGILFFFMIGLIWFKGSKYILENHLKYIWTIPFTLIGFFTFSLSDYVVVDGRISIYLCFLFGILIKHINSYSKITKNI